MFCKCGRSTELQKSANESLVSPTIYLEAKFPIYPNTHSGYLKMQFGVPISIFRCPILFGKSLLLKRNNMKHASICFPHIFLFFSTN